MSKSISDMFIKEAIKTESSNFPAIYERITDERIIRLLHASMGLVTEAAELMDALKKYIFYGKELDLVNIKEEIGDSQWYTAIALDELGNSYEEIWAAVIKKLQARYKGKFNEEGAINRDLVNERSILEQDLTKAIVNKVKMEIIDDPIVHWIDDVGLATETITCGIKQSNEKITLDEKLLTCKDCMSILYARTQNKTQICN